MTRRRLRRLHSDAEKCYTNGSHWESGYKVAAPVGPLRIAFDAGRQAERDRKSQNALFPNGMPLDVWVQVLADWMRSY